MSLNRLLACAMLTLSLGYSGVGAEQNVPARYGSDPKPVSDLSSELAQSLYTKSLGSRAGRAELDALKIFYEGRRYEPVWVAGTGYTAAAQLVRAEMERADEWGLEASALRIPALPEGERLTLPPGGSSYIAEITTQVLLSSCDRYCVDNNGRSASAAPRTIRSQRWTPAQQDQEPRKPAS